MCSKNASVAFKEKRNKLLYRSGRLNRFDCIFFDRVRGTQFKIVGNYQ